MTISSTYSPVQYNGNGVTTVFAFPYEFYNSTDLIVKSTVILTGVTTTLTITTDYTVSGGNGSTGNVTFVVAPASTVRITIERAIPYTQTQDYQENTAFPAATLETGLDKAVVMAQQAKVAADLALKFPATDPSASLGDIPNSVARANAILSFDNNGVPSATQLASLGAAINVSLTSPQNGDALTYNAGSWLNRSVLASLGTNIASAATTAISAADSDFVTITGTTGITSFGTPASLSRKHIWAVFAGAVTITHNATTLILPGAANYTTAAGDVLECVHISGANWRVVGITKANGQAVVSSASGLVPIATTTVSSPVTSVDFVHGTGGVVFDGTYKLYVIEVINLIPSTDSTQTYIRTTTNSGVSYDSTGGDYVFAGSYQTGTTTITGQYDGSSTEIRALQGFSAGSSTGEAVSLMIKIYNPANTAQYKLIQTLSVVAASSSAAASTSNLNGYRTTLSAVNGIRIFQASGNIASGTFKLYGMA